MLKSDYDRLTLGRTPIDANEACLAQARYERAVESAAYASWSGADRADAPRHGLAADLYCLLGAGADATEAFDYVTGCWLRYASKQRDQVARAGTIKSGPSAGHSVLAHRWVSDDLTWAHHVVRMVEIISARQGR